MAQDQMLDPSMYAPPARHYARLLETVCRMHTKGWVHCLVTGTSAAHGPDPHTALCDFYVSAVHGERSGDGAAKDLAADHCRVISATQAMVEGYRARPRARKGGAAAVNALASKFFAEFHALATSALMGAGHAQTQGKAGDEIKQLRSDLAKADRRAGAALRELEEAQDRLFAYTRHRDRMKSDWGADWNVSFDKVWEEALALKRSAGQRQASTVGTT